MGICEQSFGAIGIPQGMDDNDPHPADLESGQLAKGSSIASERVAESVPLLDSHVEPSLEVRIPECSVEPRSEVGVRQATE